MSRIVIFEDPENRKVLRVSDEVGVNEEFCLGKDCWDCSVFDKAEEGGIETCTRWVLENPHEAGKLMGYKVVAVQGNTGEEEKDNSEENEDEVQIEVHTALAPSLMDMLNGIYKCLTNLKEKQNINKYLITMDDSHYIGCTAISALLTNTHVVDVLVGYENLFVKLQFDNDIECTIYPFRNFNGEALGLSSECIYIVPCKEKIELLK